MVKLTNELKHILKDVYLNPPLPETEVEKFEKQHSISLPEDYRDFIINVGNGGDGPAEYGLLKLGEFKSNDVPNYLNNGYKDKLKKEFPFKDFWLWDGKEKECDFKEKLESTEHGCLVLGNDGCGMYWLLIVNGDSKGQIWQTTEMGIQPCLPYLSFTQWYKNWLEGNTDWWSGYNNK